MEEEPQRSRRPIPTFADVQARLQVCAKNGKAVEAMLILQEAQTSKVALDSSCFGSAIAACAKAPTPQIKRARSLLRRMIAAGLAPDAAAYMAVARACCRGGEAKAAMELLQEAESRGLEVAPRAYLVALEAAASYGRPDDAEALLEEVLARDAALARVHKGISVDAATNATSRERAGPTAMATAKAATAASGVGEARDVVEEGEEEADDDEGTEEGDNMDSGTNFGRSSDDDDDAVEAAAEEAVAEAVAAERRRAYTLVMTAYAKGANRATPEAQARVRALEVRMQAEGLSHNRASLTAAVKACLAAGQAAEAATLLLEAAVPPVKPVVYHSVLSALGRSGQHKPVLPLVAAMRERGAPLHAALFRVVAAALAVADDVAGMQALLEQMEQLGVPIDKYTYSSGLGLAARKGETKMAAYLVREIAREARQGATVAAAQAARNGAAGTAAAPHGAGNAAALAADDGSDAFDVGEEGPGPFGINGEVAAAAVAEALAPGRPPLPLPALNSLVTACARGGRVEDALRIIDNMRGQGPFPNLKTYRPILSALARTSEVTEALEIVETMLAEGLTPGIGGFTLALRGCARGGNYRRAAALLERMRELEVEPTVVAYGCALDACAKAGDAAAATTAVALFDEMFQAGEALQPNRIIYTTMVDALGKGGAYQKVLSILELMRLQGVEPSVETFTAAMSAMAKGEQVMTALALLREMRRDGIAPNAVTYSAALDACARTGQPDAAMQLLQQMRAEEVPRNAVHYLLAIGAFDRQAEQAAVAERILVDTFGTAALPALDAEAYNTAIAACSAAAVSAAAAGAVSESEGLGNAGGDEYVSPEQRRMVLSLLERMVRVGVAGNSRTREAALAALPTSEERARAEFLLDALGLPAEQAPVSAVPDAAVEAQQRRRPPPPRGDDNEDDDG